MHKKWHLYIKTRASSIGLEQPVDAVFLMEPIIEAVPGFIKMTVAGTTSYFNAIEVLSVQITETVLSAQIN